MQTESSKALAMLAVIMIVWGITPVFVRSVSVALGPYDALVIRLVISALVFSLILSLTEGFSFPKSDLPRLLLVSFFGLLFYFSFSVFGFAYAPAGIGTLIMSAQPILIGLIAWAIGAERITIMTVIGLLISLVGSALLVWGDDLGVAATNKADVLLGCALIFIASIGWAFYVVFSRPLIQRNGAIKITCFCNMLIALPALPFVRFDMLEKIAAMPASGKWGLAMLASVGTVSVIGWNYAAPRLRPTVLGSGLYVMPVVAVLAGWLMLDEAITLQIIVAAAIILTGVAVSQLKPFHLQISRNKS